MKLFSPFPPHYTISLPLVMLFLPFSLQLSCFVSTLDALNMNPQKERSLRSSKLSRGKILKRKVSQEPQEERSSRSSRSSRGEILKRLLKRSFVVKTITRFNHHHIQIHSALLPLSIGNFSNHLPLLLKST